MKHLSITRLIKNTPKINGVFLEKIKDKILGKKYELSLVFISSAHSKKLNKQYRKKNKPADILSFAISKEAGEIFISPAGKKNFHFLFIHGLCHLKGMRHGSRMELVEQKYRKFFNIPNS